WHLTIAKNRQGMSSATGASVELIWRPLFQQFIERAITPSDEEGAEINSSPRRYARKRSAGGISDEK
ncbi:MAG TPA: hypothetical protein VHD63_29260, partial [Ktedonobacteraceae bacterium]|nr:hypothetical protein [Ktedonobacteraceae bacterium]